jgi:hypothetical protein
LADGGRQAVRGAKKAADPDAEATAHRAVDEIKQALGERGPVWWDDGSTGSQTEIWRRTHFMPAGMRN